MATQHRALPRFGVQFHPESILTPEGPTIVANFLAPDGASGRGAVRAVGERPAVLRDLAARDRPRPRTRRRGSSSAGRAAPFVQPGSTDPWKYQSLPLSATTARSASSRGGSTFASSLNRASVEPTLQPEPRAHRRAPAVATIRPGAGLATRNDREVQPTVNRSAWSTSPACTSSQRTRPAKIGSPAASALVQPRGPQGVRAQVEDRAAAGARVPAVPPGGEELVERAVALVDHQRVPVGAALDRDVRAERIRTGIALVA